MSSKVIGGAVIGYGGMGNFHSEKMQTVDGIELIGVYDIDPERNKLAESKGIHAYSTREELLADPRIELVTVATPNDVHKEIVIAALAAGKNVICEKPVSMNSAELEEMIAAANKYGKLFTVHQNRRWDEDYLNTLYQGDSGYIDYLAHWLSEKLAEENAIRIANGEDVYKEADGTEVAFIY